MATRARRNGKQEIARRGRAVYASKIRRKVAREKKGRVVALDIETADFEVADNALRAAERLLARRPDAQVWLERIGYRTLRRFGTWHGESSTR